ncbi:MAG: serine/threonine-protein kinase [Myxococcota bacterium]
MVGRVIEGKYRVLGAVGEGGMSSIYEAEPVGGRGRVALKVLHPSLADDREAIARLRQEAEVVSTIGHPNICRVYDLGRTGEGAPYLVMELLEGESLAERIKADGRMSFAALAPIVEQVLAALGAAHAKGILHRDLKPENVFIKRGRGRAPVVAKLLDFGISKTMSYEFVDAARLTHSGMVMGTPYYMAPEQARGDSGLDQRVDLWAVGVVLYEALTGRRPFVATNYNALLVKILTSRPRPVRKLVPGLPEPVVALVDRSLSKLREDRFQTAPEFIDAVIHARRAIDAAAASSSPMASPSRWPEAHERRTVWARVRDELPPAVASITQLDEPMEVTIQDAIPTFLDPEDEASETDGTVVMGPDELRALDRVEVAGSASAPTTAPVAPPEPEATPTRVFRPRDVRVRPGRSAGARPQGPPGTNPRPSVPRPRAEPDDQEKTTLFDLASAKAALARRRRRRDDDAEGPE